MRFPILILAIASAVCRAQPPEDAVLSVYRQMERAEQTGDAETWFRLWSARSDTAAHPEMKSMVHARPSVHYGVSKVIVDGDRAALAG